MKYVFCSDIHGDISSLKELAIKENAANFFLHLGDSCVSKDELEPFVSVLGNCDLFHRRDYPLHRTIAFPSGKKALLAHHPLSEKQLMELNEQGYSYFFHGHTHIRKDETVAGIRVICPGSLSRPRDGNHGSYLVVTADETVERIEFRKL